MQPIDNRCAGGMVIGSRVWPVLGMGLALVLAGTLVAPAAAGIPAAATCKDAKGKAVGKASVGLLKAFGANKKTPNLAKLAGDVSKTRSKFTKAFVAAEARGGCETTSDAAGLQAETNGFVADVLEELCPSASTTTTSTTTTTLVAPCDASAPPTCGGACPPTLACGNVGLGTCACVSAGTPCGDAAFPVCGGVCPTPLGGFCLPSVGSACACQ